MFHANPGVTLTDGIKVPGLCRPTCKPTDLQVSRRALPISRNCSGGAGLWWQKCEMCILPGGALVPGCARKRVSQSGVSESQIPFPRLKATKFVLGGPWEPKRTPTELCLTHRAEIAAMVLTQGCTERRAKRKGLLKVRHTHREKRWRPGCPNWSGRADLNCRPLAPQASALPG